MKTILDNRGDAHWVWALEREYFGGFMKGEVGTNGLADELRETYFRLRVPYGDRAIYWRTWELEDGGVEFEILLRGGEESENLARLLSFAGAALKELTKASAALEEHLN